MKQEMMGWQWHQLNHIHIICILLQTYNHTNTLSLSFLWADALYAAQTTVSKHWRQKLKQSRITTEILSLQLM